MLFSLDETTFGIEDIRSYGWGKIGEKVSKSFSAMVVVKEGSRMKMNSKEDYPKEDEMKDEEDAKEDAEKEEIKEVEE